MVDSNGESKSFLERVKASSAGTWTGWLGTATIVAILVVTGYDRFVRKPGPVNPVNPVNPVDPIKPKPDPKALINVPAELKALRGRQITLTAETDLDVNWVIDNDVRKMVDIYEDRSLNTLVMTPLLEKPYNIGVFGAKDGKPTSVYWTRVTFGKEPDPVDPDPIKPDPVVPDDDYTKALKSAWTAESAADRADSLAKLRDLYQLVAKSYANDANLDTVKKFNDFLKLARQKLIEEKLPAIRDVSQTELTKILVGADRTQIPVNMPMDSEVRSKIQKFFQKTSDVMTAILGGAK